VARRPSPRDPDYRPKPFEETHNLGRERYTGLPPGLRSSADDPDRIQRAEPLQ
jgi:hypothetical protein